MILRKAYRYRLRPTPTQARALEQVLDYCRELYNAAIQERRDAYEMAKVRIDYYEQKRELPDVKEVRPEYRDVGSQVLQDVIRRVDLAFQGFFRRVAAGDKPGYPRFKGRDRYDSFTYTQVGWKIEDSRLVLAKIGAIRVRWTRPIEGTIKTVTIHRSLGQWHVCFSCVLDVPDPVTPDRPATAIDVGLESFATLADGSHIDNPRYFREAHDVLARRQRSRDRKKKGSKNRRRANRLVAKAHRRIRNKRLDFHHQEARKLVDAHGAIAFEGLRIKNMIRRPGPKIDEKKTKAAGQTVYAPNGASAKSGLNKSIHDAGWHQFLTILTHKAGEAGVVIVVVDPAGTSQVCSGCGRVVPKTLDDRWHTCPYCGLSIHRDHNSAREILNRAGLSRAGA